MAATPSLLPDVAAEQPATSALPPHAPPPRSASPRAFPVNIPPAPPIMPTDSSDIKQALLRPKFEPARHVSSAQAVLDSQTGVWRNRVNGIWRFSQSARSLADSVFEVSFDSSLARNQLTVALPEKVIIKADMNCPQQVFAARASQMVRLGTGAGDRVPLFRVPGIRVVEYVQTEWSDIKEVLYSLSTPEDHIRSKARKQLNRPVFMVMEWVHGTSLEGIGMNPDAANYVLAASPDDENCFANRVLLQLGHMLAFDMFFNNWDRFPLPVWSHDGNIGNQLIDVDSDDVKNALIGIDQAITSIGKPGGPSGQLDAYLTKCQRLLSSCCNRSAESPGIRSGVRDFIAMLTGVDIDAAGSLCVQRGIEEGAAALVDIPSTTWEEVLADVRALVKTDWANVWKNECDLIQVSFLEEMRDCFRRGLEGTPSS